MIHKVGTVSLFVNNQDQAKDFYVNKLGFEVRRDAPMSATARWIAVAPAGAETEIILYIPDENWSHYRQVVGQSQAITLDVTNLRQLCDDLKAKGVQVVQEPDEQPWGTFAMILDSENNRLLLVEQPKGV